MTVRTPGEGRYAQREREQRWRVDELPRGMTGSREIVDLYVTGTRLRLRTVTSDGVVVYKLAQKVRVDAADPAVVKITNTYLSLSEFAVLRELPAARIRKFRNDFEWRERQFAIDVFADRHEGIILAEIELGDNDTHVPLPLFARVDVTHDDRFSGGALAVATDGDLALLFRD